MKNPGEDLTVGFISLGLIGGSIARAIRSRYPSATIVAWNRSRQSIREAVADGVVDAAPLSIGEDFSHCDLIFLCAPVQVNCEKLRELQPFLRPDTIVTDVGSVKNDIHTFVRSLGLQSQFIGGHPMTGSERVGYRNSNSLLLENAYYILAPEPEVPQEKVRQMDELISSLGALTLVLSPQEHDFVTAGVSHVPHVISAALVNLVKESDNPEEIMKTIAAGGFKDITRISSSSPQMWEQICLTNADNIVTLLDRYMADLSRIRDEIAARQRDEIHDFFDGARQYRDGFSEQASGPIRRRFVIHVDIADRPGVLAEVVGVLAANAINIRNIGITHNREYQEGVLEVELPGEQEQKKAGELLLHRGYVLH